MQAEGSQLPLTQVARITPRNINYVESLEPSIPARICSILYSTSEIAASYFECM